MDRWESGDRVEMRSYAGSRLDDEHEGWVDRTQWLPATFLSYERIPGVCRIRLDGESDPFETVTARLRPRNPLDRLAEET
jgi:hypothetical protein